MKNNRLLHFLIIMLLFGILLTIPVEGSASWWDKFGEPKYGGSVVFQRSFVSPSWDNSGKFWPPSAAAAYWDTMFRLDWTIDPVGKAGLMINGGGFVTEEYFIPNLALSWELESDLSGCTVKLRKGVHWMNRPPMNGRELVAADVQAHYDRALGTGSGFGKPDPFMVAQCGAITKVTAKDDYTLYYEFRYPNVMNIYDVLETDMAGLIEPVDLVKQEGGSLDRWEVLCGTGPFIVTDYVDNSSITYTKNDEYWGIDERHPENSVPYLDEVKYVAIPDRATSLAAMRTGKIDYMQGLTPLEAKRLEKTNPEIKAADFMTTGPCIDFRCDNAPFTDIRVRKALCMAVDRKAIASVLTGGTGQPCGSMSEAVEGWVIPYAEWPQDIKAGYSFNVEGARKLLAEAAADGIFKPNKDGGFDTNLVAPGSYLQRDNGEILEIIESQFNSIGVNCKINVMDTVTHSHFVRAGKHDQMSFDVACGHTWSPARITDIRTSTSGRNGTYNNDAVYDAMVEDWKNAKTMGESKQLFKKLYEYALGQYWTNYFFQVKQYQVWNPRIQGLSGQQLVDGGLGWPTWARIWVAK